LARADADPASMVRMTTSRLSFRPLLRIDRMESNPPRVDKPVIEAVWIHIGYRNVASDCVRRRRTVVPLLVLRASLCSNDRISRVRQYTPCGRRTHGEQWYAGVPCMAQSVRSQAQQSAPEWLIRRIACSMQRKT